MCEAHTFTLERREPRTHAGLLDGFGIAIVDRSRVTVDYPGLGRSRLFEGRAALRISASPSTRAFVSSY